MKITKATEKLLKEREDELFQTMVEHVTEISQAMKKFNQSRLKRRVILLLLKDLTNLGVRDIEIVLNGLESLEKTYLKPVSLKESK